MDGPTYGSPRYPIRTVSFQSVLYGAIRRTGADPAELDDNSTANACEFLQSWTKKAWEWEFWPELTPLEFRAYRDAWAIGTAYVASIVGAPTEIWYPPAQSYAQCLTANTGHAPFVQLNGVWVPNTPYWELSTENYSAVPWVTGANYVAGVPGTPASIVVSPIDNNNYECIVPHTSGANFDPTKFTILTTFEKYVALDQNGMTPIGEVSQISRCNPRTNPRFPGVITFVIDNRGILPAPASGVQVWVLFRMRPPKFTTEAYAGGDTYGAGDVVYQPSTTGECYVSLINANTGNTPEANPAKWELQPMPEILAEAVKLGTYSELLRSDGQNDKADDEEEKAGEKLTLASDTTLLQQGQVERAGAQVYA